ncbi:MAG: c-type cytochrome [Rhizobiales bacterium]|nr:c-type cytochrome [Hyphomicrobiales bacterium]
MDSFEFNKIAGAVLAALIVIFGTRTLMHEMNHSGPPEKSGYEVEIASATPSAGGDAGAAEAVPPIGARLATADVAAGEKVFKKCTACHGVEAGGANRVGPNLHNIVGRGIGAVDGFAYSGPMKEHGGAWDYEALDAFLANPKGYMKGTKMAFAGIKKPDERADLIAYLKANTENPPALPAQ